jgi:hypothetical protein
MNQTHQFTRPVTLIFVITITALGFSLPVASRAQSGGPGTDHGIVDSIDDMKLDIRGGGNRHTRTYTETDQTRWLNSHGQPIDPGDTVGKTVDVRWRWITGGSEALSVQITSGGGNSPAARNDQAATSSTADKPNGDAPSRRHWPEQVIRGTIGGSEAVFRLNTNDDGTINGTYSQGSKTYRIKGTGQPGHMSLDEYTGERLTAHIKLTLDDLETTWTGTMYNVYPNKNQYPVSLSKSH